MTFIYDFDGTLTKFGFPRYPILEQYGNINDFYSKVLKHKDVYKGFVDEYKKILNENGKKATKESISYKSTEVALNNGVAEFLEYFQNEKSDHFVVTSGFEEYVRNTPIAHFFKRIIGTTLDDNEEIIRLMNDEKKVEAIQEIIKEYQLNPEEIIYFGDGLTDKYAFEYIKKIGGKSILVYDTNNENDKEVLHKLSALNIINEAFPKDFSFDSELFNYIKSLTTMR